MLRTAYSRARNAARVMLGRAPVDPAFAASQQEVKQLEGVVRQVLKRDYGGDLMPQEDLRLHVGTKTTAANFWAQGANSARRTMETFGETPEGPVLDWGCGSGRTLNWLKRYPGWRDHWHGCDVDAEAIAWLTGKGFANAKVCADNPPLPYEDNTFTGLYAYSVLTHIPPDRHDAWYAEIARVLRPGGRAYLTTQGEGVVAAGRAPLDATAEYHRTGAAYVYAEGHYKDAALVSERFTRALLDKHFETLSYKANGYQNMDAFLVRKR